LAHQVFVSYATEDADTASRVCALLEADGISCWIAPRDVKAGTDYAAAIMNAIRNSQLVVLVFSTHSNASPYALREVERSVAYGRPVLALRTDDADPSSSLEYYLHEWTAAPDGVESKRREIIATVRQQLARPSTAATSTDRGAASTPRPPMPLQPGSRKVAARTRAWYRGTWGIAAAAVLVVAALGLGLGLGLIRDHAASRAGPMGNHIAWAELSSSGTPLSSRFGHSMTYDPVTRRLIMFGGKSDTAITRGVYNAGTAPLNDTWAYDLTANAWKELKPSGTLPSARFGQSMASDPTSGRLIMFGGNAGTASLDDTWAYDPTTNAWTELKPSGTVPPPRDSATMEYDPTTRRLIMFGGKSDTAITRVVLNDTWVYDPANNTWTELKPSGTVPSARSGHSMAYDPVTRRLIMFGGNAGTASLNDTWAYDPTTNAWTELEPSGTVPSARSGHSMAHDSVTHRLIMFGGHGLSGAGTDLGDTWAYDPTANAWTELKPSGTLPYTREAQSMASDPTSGRLIMFGGRGGGTSSNDTWAYDPTANTWTELKPSGTLPPARSGHSMAYDPTRGRLILFGGNAGTAPLINDTWAYDLTANTWTELKPSGTLPPARSGHSMVYDPSSGRLIMFGGSGDAALLNDTWAYDPTANTWNELKPSGTLPPARFGQSMTYDPVTHHLIVFGGLEGSGTPLNDTWAYDPTANSWDELEPSGTLPPARSAHSMTYDPVTHRLIVFGGLEGSGTPLNDTWAYDPTANSWTELKPAGTVPSARDSHSMAYDLTGGRMIMFGGQSSAGTSLDDTWAYDSAANTWTELEPSGAQPLARAGQVMVYDPASGRLIMFGGRSIGPSDFRNDVWTCS
jgi:N-acetylneuraminic acid mutarotase